MNIRALKKAIEIAGGQSNLARQIGTKQSNIWWWLNRSGTVPTQFIMPICRATGQSHEEFLMQDDPASETAA